MTKKSPLFIATISTIIATIIFSLIKYFIYEPYLSFKWYYISLGWWDIPIFAIIWWIAIFLSWKDR